MLALPIKYVKDAARSVKRICEQEFKKVEDSVLTDLLGISRLALTMFALVLSDVERRCILNILPERSKEALENWLDRNSELFFRKNNERFR